MSLDKHGSGRRHLPPVRVRHPSERKSLSRSATRALDILEFFGQARRPLRAIEISRMLDMRPSTTDQLLKTMVDSSHLVFDAQSKTYLPSPRLVGFGSWVVDMFGADQWLRNLVRDVQRRTKALITLTTPNDVSMQVVDLAVPRGEQAERGTRISLFGSAVGAAYLSTLDDDAFVRLADRARIDPADIPDILEEFDRIRRDGFAQGPTGEEFWSIAIPLPAEGLSFPMVLGLAGRREHVKANAVQLKDMMAEAIRDWFSRHEH